MNERATYLPTVGWVAPPRKVDSWLDSSLRQVLV
jgi:hypothetical protein